MIFYIIYLTALPDSDPIVKALRVLDTSRWPVYKRHDTAELDAYGNDTRAGAAALGGEAAPTGSAVK